jgi:hypothetical protein
MPEFRGKCFVIMPFRNDLHYFYLYLEKHIQERHRLVCNRADRRITTGSIIDKIKDDIAEADVVLAECTGSNPNVFYELGFAHAQGKNVVLLIQRPADFKVEDIPMDVRHLDFILYQLENHEDFLKKLDKAIDEIFIKKYDVFYRRAKSILNRFKQDFGISADVVSKDEFITSLKKAEEIQRLPTLDVDEKTLAEFLLPRIIANSSSRITAQINEWLIMD